MQYNFEWDPHKAKANIVKHSVNFQQATEVFWDALQLTIFDEEHSDTEDRWITLGKTQNGILLVVMHTFSKYENNITIRIISARKATQHEQHQYEGNQ
ncbi:BrnT family toxin [Nitrosomonas communis]|uniref:BrnT family toxin n=1 Tax=Nitrosomonas communis TaxID=44574 RepID=A0A1H2V4H2_9PROT|nr:BrnT family toxin [Nitrosomonas communis]SDW63203.1 hypothetical protein SAMN05421882_101951 [Nitrosomonas communis]